MSSMLIQNKKFDLEHEKMTTPTTRLETGSICGRLPFDVSDDNTKEAVNQEVKLDFLNVLKFSK